MMNLYMSLSANTIMAKLTNQFQRTRIITSSPDKHYSDSEAVMTSAQVVETSVTNNSSFQNYPHPEDHTMRTTDTPGLGSNQKVFNFVRPSKSNQRTLFILLIYSCFSRHYVPTNSVVALCHINPHTTHNSSIRSYIFNLVHITGQVTK